MHGMRVPRLASLARPSHPARAARDDGRANTMPAFVERFALTGKKALVTGASKGIGLEICRVLADAGADVVAVARDRAGLEEARARDRGRRAAVPGDRGRHGHHRGAAARRRHGTRGLGDDRHPGQQCRHCRSRADPRDDSRGLGPRPGGQSPGTVPPGPGAGTRDDRAARGKIVDVSSQTSGVALDRPCRLCAPPRTASTP